MPFPSAPTPDIAISPLDPTYIPFTIADPDGSAITIDDFPHKEAKEYRRLLQKIRANLLAGDIFSDEAFAFLQTTNNLLNVAAWTITDAGAPTSIAGVDGGAQQIDVTWLAPTDEGSGGTIAGYEIQFFDEATPGTIFIASGTVGDVTLLRSIQTAGAATYTVSVFTINEKGTSTLFDQATGIVVA